MGMQWKAGKKIIVGILQGLVQHGEGNAGEWSVHDGYRICAVRAVLSPLQQVRTRSQCSLDECSVQNLPASVTGAIWCHRLITKPAGFVLTMPVLDSLCLLRWTQYLMLLLCMLLANMLAPLTSKISHRLLFS